MKYIPKQSQFDRYQGDITYTYYFTYMHNWPLQPFSQDYGLASHTIHIVCINFIHEWRDLLFNVNSEQ